jgi:crossover junction endodeoxyribonuclease RuvC
MSFIIGIDPGVSGAIALLHGRGELVSVHDMPVHDSRVDGRAVAAHIGVKNPMVKMTCVVENTQPMPKNGSVASFKLGMATGVVLGCIQTLQHPLVRIRPQEWKKTMGLIKKDKNASRGLARELWPHLADEFKLVKHDGRAEAALIAEAYRRTEHGRNNGN